MVGSAATESVAASDLGSEMMEAAGGGAAADVTATVGEVTGQ